MEDKATMSESIQQQIERIVHSEQFRSSEVLRRLLTFLSEKSIAGEADYLKEYVVAIDGLGKSSTYDPQHNSAVRIQMGRRRQRLAEYYRSEGKNDPMIVDLPKRRCLYPRGKVPLQKIFIAAGVPRHHPAITLIV